MATYLKFARHILNGELPDYFYYQPFYYTIYLPVALCLSGGSTFGVGMTQAVLGAAGIWFTGMCAGRLFGRAAGMIAATMLCLARFHIFYTPFMLMATLQSFLIVFLLFLVLRAYDHNRWFDWTWVALGLSVTILTRGNAILFLPLILALLAWRNRSRKKILCLVIPAFVVLMYLPQLPFALRNLDHFGRWVGPSSAKEAVLALGNTPESPAGGLFYSTAYKDWMEQAARSGDERVPVIRNISRWILREPLAFAELKLRMFLLFWDRREIPNNVVYSFFAPYSSCLRFPVLLGFGVIAPLAVWGLFTVRYQGKPGRLFAAGMVAVYCLSTVLFYILARFRLPVVPLLCVFAGGGGQMAVRHVKALRANPPSTRSSRRLIMGWVAAVVIVWSLYPVYSTCWGPYVLRVARPSGTGVSLTDCVLAQDHLPFLPFGWSLLDLDNRFLELRKRLVFPKNKAPERAVINGVAQVAFYASPGSEIEFKFNTPNGGVRTSKTVFSADGSGPRHWIPVPFSVNVEQGTAKLSFTVRKLKGDVALAFDPRVNYGRTRLGENSAPLEPLKGELVCRVFVHQKAAAGL